VHRRRRGATHVGHGEEECEVEIQE
jgi:hypothetical protein